MFLSGFGESNLNQIIYDKTQIINVLTKNLQIRFMVNWCRKVS